MYDGESSSKNIGSMPDVWQVLSEIAAQNVPLSKNYSILTFDNQVLEVVDALFRVQNFRVFYELVPVLFDLAVFAVLASAESTKFKI